MTTELLEIVTERMPLIEVLPDVAKALGQEHTEFVRKHYVCKADIADGERAVVAFVSTEDIDRDGEIIKTAGIDLKHFRKNPVVLWGHDHNTPPVAKAEWIKRDKKGDVKGLLAKAIFAEHALADEIFTLYKGGFLKAFSIGFIVTGYRQPKENEFGDDTDKVRGIIEKCQLLEFSCCNVPANQAALVQAVAKSAIVLSDGVRESLGLSRGKTDEFDEAWGNITQPQREALQDMLGLDEDGHAMVLESPKRICPECGSHEAYIKEIHPDTSMDEIVGHCPDCNYEGDPSEFGKVAGENASEGLLDKTCHELMGAGQALRDLAADFRKVHLPEAKAVPTVEVVHDVPVEEKAVVITEEMIQSKVNKGIAAGFKKLEDAFAQKLTELTGRVTPTK